jgi:uncharacterized membrane protein YcaP (DUF421 family)
MLMSDLISSLHDLVVPGIPVLEKVLRPIVVYAFLLLGLRMAGKRCLASLNAFDLVVLLSISNTVQNAIIGNDSSVTGGMIGAATLLITNYAVVRFFFKHRRLDELVEGKATVLIKEGQVLRKNLDAELITVQELEIAAHKQGFRSLDDIEYAEIEPGGAVAFFEKKPTTQEARDEDLHRKLDALAAAVERLSRPRGPEGAATPG